MQRFGRVLRLREGAESGYEKYHTEVWPKVLNSIRQTGIRNYSIFRYGRWLFAYFELPEDIKMEGVGKILANCEHCRRWEELMHTLQEPLPESQGESWWVPMQESFHFAGA